MKDKILSVNKIYFIVIALVQAILGIIWVVLKAGKGHISPVSFFVGIVIIVGVSMLFMLRKGKVLWIALALYIITFPTVLDTISQTGHMALLPDKPAGNIYELCVQRFAWPNFYGNDSLTDLSFLPTGIGMELSASPQGLWTKLFPAMEENLGSEEANTCYMEITKSIVSNNKKSITVDLVSDFLSYVAAPVIPVANLHGISGSYTGENYMDFVDGTGKLGRFYFYFGCVSWAVLLLLGILSCIVKGLPGKKSFWFLFAIIVLMSLYNIFCPLRGFDYKNASIIVICWIFIVLLPIRRKNADI